MRPMSISLPVGPYDWNSDRISQSVFADRLGAVRAVMQQHGLDALVVHGNMFDHGALAYLTHFTPKLGPAFALVPAEGALRLLFTGGPGMKPSAARLTWIDDVRALRSIKSDLSAWLDERPGSARFGLWVGSAMSHDVTTEVVAALGAGRASHADALLTPLMRCKTALERGFIGRAAAILDATLTRLRRATTEGIGVRSATLLAEAVAYSEGAQDVRWLVSARPGGEPEPLDVADDPRVAPLLVSLAIRYGGYWAEGHVTLGLPATAARPAADALARVVDAVRRGVPLDELTGLGGPEDVRVTLNGVGLASEEWPLPGLNHRIEPGDVLSVRIDVPGSEQVRLVASALIAVTDSGTERLWSGVPF